MKLISFFTFILLSLSVMAQKLPKEKSPCNWGSSCIDYKGLDVIFSRLASMLNTVGLTSQKYPGVYYQRATGRTCKQAFAEAKNKMRFNHHELVCDGNELYCGAANVGPKLLGNSCSQSSDGKIVAWLVCDNSGHTPRRQGDPGTGFILLHMLRESEKRHGHK